MPWIANISREKLKQDQKIWSQMDCVLIQISDPGYPFLEVDEEFKAIYQYEFLDLEKNDPDPFDNKISKDQIENISFHLENCLQKGLNVLVQCTAGACRSGAVVEVGILLGFKDRGLYRTPNLDVKHKLCAQLGLNFDPLEPFTENGKPFFYDELNNKVYLRK